MNVLIAADMEGIGGIDDYRACLPSHPAAYARGCRLMTDEVMVVADALRAAGVEGVSVGDWHMVGTNVERARLGEGIEVRPNADLALVEEDPSFEKANGGPVDAVVLVGHHASTRHPRGFSSHTFIWEMEVELDGEPMSEVRVYAQALAAEGVPVLAVSGDRWMLEEMEEGELGSARAVATKEGLGRGRARAFGLASVRSELAAAVREALAGPLQPPPARRYPAELRIAVEGEELSRSTVADASGLLAEVARVFRTSRASHEYRQLARLLPSGHRSALRRAQRRLGSIAATLPMMAKEREWIASGARL